MREEIVIAGSDYPRIVYRYLPNRIDLGSYLFYFSADQTDHYRHPEFLHEHWVITQISEDPIMTDGLPWMTDYSMEHAVTGFAKNDLTQVAMSIATEYCRQIACGAKPLPNGKELAKRYVKGHVLYLFSQPSDAKEFASSAVGLVI